MGELSYTTGGDSNLVSFRSAARVPITSLKAHFLPKQDLHGYSKPWVGGTGKNLLTKRNAGTLAVFGITVITYEDGSININGISTGTFGLTINDSLSLKAGSYILSGCPADGTNDTYCLEILNNGSDTGSGYNFTLSNDTDNLFVRVTIYSGAQFNNVTFYPMIRLASNNDATWEPYENICPIEGWNECTIYQDKDNISIPDEYQKVEYIEGKNAFMDLDYIIQTDPRVIVTMTINDSTDQDIMGFKNNTQPSFIIDPAPLTNRWYNRYYSTTGMAINNSPPIAGEKYTWEFGNITKLNNQIVYTFYTNTTSIDWSVNTQKFYLFGARNWHKDLIIYDFELYDGNTLVRKLIPCYRKSDNVVGMYDTVSNTFFINERAAGQLIAGPVIQQTIPITFPILGKNKFNINTMEQGGIIGASGKNTTSTKRIRSDYIEIIANQQYCISFSGVDKTYIFLYDVNKQFISSAGWKLSGFTFTSTQNGYVRFSFTMNKGIEIIPTDIINPQLELGNTATTYEEYNSNNLLYGGYIDIAKGELVQTYSYVQYDSSNLNYLWYQFSDPTAPIGIGFRKNISTDFNVNTDMLCDKLPILYNNTSQNFPYLYAYTDSSSVYGCIIIGVTADYPNLQTQTDVDNVCKNWVNDHGPFMIARKFKNPITYPLSKTELKTLLNQNNIWSNTNDITEVSYAVHDSTMIRSTKKRIIANEPHIETTNGIMTNFTTDMIAPLKSLKLYFEPIQAGSGEPSINNIRNLSGRNVLYIGKLGENLCEKLPPIVRNGYIKNNNGEETTSNNYFYISTMYPTSNNSYMAIANIQADPWRIYYLNSQGELISKSNYFSSPQKSSPVSIPIPTNCSYIQLQVINNGDINNLAIYASATYFSADWRSIYNPIYCGYVDFINGDLVQTYDSYTFTGINADGFQYFTDSTLVEKTRHLFQTTILSNVVRNGPNTIDSYSNIADRAHYSFPRTNDLLFNVSGSQITLYIEQSLCDATVESFNQWLSEHPWQIVYPLENPIHYSLTPQIIKTLQGQNNFSAELDTNISIDYYTH